MLVGPSSQTRKLPTDNEAESVAKKEGAGVEHDANHIAVIARVKSQVDSTPGPGCDSSRYSALSATRGSSLVARSAGISVATSATEPSTMATSENVAGSAGSTPNS